MAEILEYHSANQKGASVVPADAPYAMCAWRSVPYSVLEMNLLSLDQREADQL